MASTTIAFGDDSWVGREGRTRQMRARSAIGISFPGPDAPRRKARPRSGGETTLDRRRTAIALIFVALLALGWSPPAAAQPIERPTDCTEAMSVGAIFIGHDCGEWASVLISGNVIIRKPWSRANRASRAVRLRERREGSPVTPTPTPIPDRDSDADPDPEPLDGPPPVDERNGNRGGTTVDGLQVELRCEATPERTTITNNGAETVIVTEIRSLAGPPVAGEEGAPDPDLAIAPGQTRIYETGAGADPASGGISSPIYDDDRLSEEGARVVTSTGESIEAPCVAARVASSR